MNEFEKKVLAMGLLAAYAKTQPAIIEYKINEKLDISAKQHGRSIDLDMLVALIVKDRIDELKVDIDAYFEMLKESIKIIKSSKLNGEEKENSENSLKKFKDIFKDLDL